MLFRSGTGRLSYGSKVPLGFLSPPSLRKRALSCAAKVRSLRKAVQRYKLRWKEASAGELVSFDEKARGFLQGIPFSGVEAATKEAVVAALTGCRANEEKWQLPAREIEAFAERAWKLISDERKKLGKKGKGVRFDARAKRIALAVWLEH